MTVVDISPTAQYDNIEFLLRLATRLVATPKMTSWVAFFEK